MCPSSTFSSKSNLKKHQYTRHPGGILELPAEGGSSADDEEEDIDCYEEDGAAITNGHEVDEGVLNGRARFRCHVCQHPVQVFSDRLTALSHLKLKHPVEYDALAARGDVAQNDSFSSHDNGSSQAKTISCLFCSNSFDTPDDLRSHMTSCHTGLITATEIKSENAQEIQENQQRKKRANLMDKINQLSANASSIQTIFSKHQDEKLENKHLQGAAIAVE